MTTSRTNLTLQASGFAAANVLTPAGHEPIASWEVEMKPTITCFSQSAKVAA